MNVDVARSDVVIDGKESETAKRKDGNLGKKVMRESVGIITFLNYAGRHIFFCEKQKCNSFYISISERYNEGIQ